LKKSFLIGGIITALVIAAAVNFYPQQTDAPRNTQFRGRMLEKLNLTDDQQDKIEQLRLKNQEEMIDLRADLQKKRLAVEQLRQKGDYSRSNYLDLVNDLNASRDKIAVARANHRMDVYELLTDQQKDIFNRMPMMGGRGGEGRGMMDGCGQHDGQRQMRKHPGANRQ